MGLKGDDASSTKCIQDTLKGHCKLRSNEIVATRVYEQLVQGDLGLAECIEKCKEVKVAYNFGADHDISLRIAIILGLRNQ